MFLTAAGLASGTAYAPVSEVEGATIRVPPGVKVISSVLHFQHLLQVKQDPLNLYGYMLKTS